MADTAALRSYIDSARAKRDQAQKYVDDYTQRAEQYEQIAQTNRDYADDYRQQAEQYRSTVIQAEKELASYQLQAAQAEKEAYEAMQKATA